MVKGYEHPRYGTQGPLSRKHLNSRVARVVRMYRWAVEAELVPKVHEARPNIIDRMINGEVALAINTPFGKSAFVDDTYIRRSALQHGIPCITTLTAATACVEGIRSMKEGVSTFAALQEQHAVAGRRD